MEIKFGDAVEYDGIKTQVISHPEKTGTKSVLRPSGFYTYRSPAPPMFKTVDRYTVKVAYFPNPVDVDDLKIIQQ